MSKTLFLVLVLLILCIVYRDYQIVITFGVLFGIFAFLIKITGRNKLQYKRYKSLNNNEDVETNIKIGKDKITSTSKKGDISSYEFSQITSIIETKNLLILKLKYNMGIIINKNNLDGVITVLSGMSNVEQMEDNLSYMKDFTKMSEEEKKVLDKAQEELNKIPLIPCTTCNYCAKVCPMNIGISGSFTAMNMLTLYGDMAGAKHQESWLVGGHGKKHAEECIKCGRCEEVCLQHIKIRDELVKVAETLGSN